MMVREGYKKVRIGPRVLNIPISWKVKNINELARVNGGKRVPKGKSLIEEKTNYPYIRVADFSNYSVETTNMKYATKEIYDKIKNYTILKEDVYISIAGTVGLVGIVPDELDNQLLTENAAKIVIKNRSKIHNLFLAYALSGFEPQSQIKGYIGTTGVPKLALKRVKKLALPLPSIPEQKKIASILSSVDKAIEKTEDVIKETKKLKKGLMQQLLTRGIDHSEFKEVTFGPEKVKLPNDWKIMKLSKITDVRSSNVNKKSKEGEIPVKLCNYLDVYNNNYIDNNIEFMEATAKKREIKRFAIQKGDVIITKDSETPDDIAVPAVVTKKLPNTLCGYHLTLLKPIKTLIRGEFLSKILQAIPVNNQFCRLAQGLTRYGLTVNSIKKILIPLPPIEEQKKIASILSSVDSKIQKEQEYKEGLEKLKKGLMQKLLTGEVRVKVDEEVS